jgi:7-cyano-7-deazaguanine tRNA-ribosyltransferase
MIEIKQHDGPARLGKYLQMNTPNLINLDNSLKILKDEPMPYNVPKSLAEWSVNSTIEYASNSNETGIGVVHGSKYTDLRVKCALELEKLGNSILMIANPESILRNSRDLVDIIPSLRENINPNTAIYFPFAEPAQIPFLTYMGVDFFDSVSGDYYAELNTLLTSTHSYNLDVYKLYDMNLEELKEYNHKSIEFTIKEVQEHIKNGTLRNLVEERSCSSPELMTSLRLLDRDHADFVSSYTQLY